MKDSRTVRLKPRALIEDWLPIKTIGCESMRERGASSALPPLYFLHVWWARRPLLASRAALLASVLPSWSHLAPGLESGVTDRSSDDEPTTSADRGLAADRNDRMRIHEGRERGPETSAEPPPRVVGQTAAHGQPGGAAGQRAADVDREPGTILERETVPVCRRIRGVVRSALRDLRGSGRGAEEDPVGQATRYPAQGSALHPQARLYGQPHQRPATDSGGSSPTHLGEGSAVRSGPVRRRRLHSL